jgi:hypothetical protein
MTVRHSHPKSSSISEYWPLVGQAPFVAPPWRMIAPDEQERPDITRLVVLTPDEGLRMDRLEQVLAALSIPDATQIVLASRSTARNNRSKCRRLNTLVTRLQQSHAATHGQMLEGSDWPGVLRWFTDHHDLLVCFAEQRQVTGAFRHERLSQTLLHTLRLPVVEVSGAYPPWASRLLRVVRRVLFELFPIVVGGSFLWFQIQVGNQTGGWVRSAALAMTAIVEIGLIFVWSLFLD